MNTDKKRQAWLSAMTQKLRSHFKSVGYEIPANVRVSCGWPSKGGRAAAKRTIGQCWCSSTSEGDVYEIFISPTVADSEKAAEVLAHELCHATVGIPAGHGPKFKKIATAIGLVGAMRATEAGPVFLDFVKPVIAKLGAYPHEVINGTDGSKKQTTRQLKVSCAVDGEYTVRMTQKWLDAHGAPICPCHGEVMEIA